MYCTYQITELDELEEVMKKFVLRRTKSLIASQLPHKGIHVHTCVCEQN